MEPVSTIPAPLEMSVINRIINVFIAPSKTFEHLIQKPEWVTPLIIALIMMVTFSIVMKNLIQTESVKAAREAIMKSDQIANDQKEQVIEQQTTMMKKFWFVGIAIGMVLVGAGYFLSPLFLRIGGNSLLGGTATYIQILAIYGYSTLIDFLAILVKAPLMMVNQSLRVDTGLGMLLGEPATRSALYTFLAKFDIFTFWQLAVLVIGLSILYKFSKGKAAALVIGLWLIWVLLLTGMVAMGMHFGG